MRNLVSIEIEIGMKKFAMQCESSASLQHCYEAAKSYLSYFENRIKELEQSDPNQEAKQE